MFSLLSWNIMQGGGSRILQIVDKIYELNPTVCTFSEFRNNQSGNQIRTLLLKAGYRYQFVTVSHQEENSVIILSKIPCGSTLHSGADPVYSGNIISVHFDAFSIIGAYLPHKKNHQLFNYIQRTVSEEHRPYIIAGDFNTGINFIDQKGNSFWYEKEFKSFNNIGYIDVFRRINGNQQEFSWYSHEGNGYRYDHMLAHHDLMPVVKVCRYLHEWRESKISDHSPLYVELG